MQSSQDLRFRSFAIVGLIGLYLQPLVVIGVYVAEIQGGSWVALSNGIVFNGNVAY